MSHVFTALQELFCRGAHHPERRDFSRDVGGIAALARGQEQSRAAPRVKRRPTICPSRHGRSLWRPHVHLHKGERQSTHKAHKQLNKPHPRPTRTTNASPVARCNIHSGYVIAIRVPPTTHSQPDADVHPHPPPRVRMSNACFPTARGSRNAAGLSSRNRLTRVWPSNSTGMKSWNIMRSSATTASGTASSGSHSPCQRRGWGPRAGSSRPAFPTVKKSSRASAPGWCAMRSTQWAMCGAVNCMMRPGMGSRNKCGPNGPYNATSANDGRSPSRYGWSAKWAFSVASMWRYPASTAGTVDGCTPSSGSNPPKCFVVACAMPNRSAAGMPGATAMPNSASTNGRCSGKLHR